MEHSERENRIQSDADHATWKVIHQYYRSGRFQFVGVVQPGFTLGEVGAFMTDENNGKEELEVFLATGAMKYAIPDELLPKVEESWSNFVMPLSSFNNDDSLMVVAIPPFYIIQRYADYDKARK